MANFASLRGPVGMNRVFAKLSAPLTHRRWLAALKAGRTFTTNGRCLGSTLNGRELGSELSLRPRDGEVVATVSLKLIVPVDQLEIVRKYLLRARGNGPAYPILDVYPYLPPVRST